MAEKSHREITQLMILNLIKMTPDLGSRLYLVIWTKYKI